MSCRSQRLFSYDMRKCPLVFASVTLVFLAIPSGQKSKSIVDFSRMSSSGTLGTEVPGAVCLAGPLAPAP